MGLEILLVAFCVWFVAACTNDRRKREEQERKHRRMERKKRKWIRDYEEECN